MRDFPLGCGPVPGGLWRRLGREKVHVVADRTAVGVEGAASALELSPPLRKGQSRHRAVSGKKNFKY